MEFYNELYFQKNEACNSRLIFSFSIRKNNGKESSRSIKENVSSETKGCT